VLDLLASLIATPLSPLKKAPTLARPRLPPFFPAALRAAPPRALAVAPERRGRAERAGQDGAADRAGQAAREPRAHRARAPEQGARRGGGAGAGAGGRGGGGGGRPRTGGRERGRERGHERGRGRRGGKSGKGASDGAGVVASGQRGGRRGAAGRRGGGARGARGGRGGGGGGGGRGGRGRQGEGAPSRGQVLLRLWQDAHWPRGRGGAARALPRGRHHRRHGCLAQSGARPARPRAPPGARRGARDAGRGAQLGAKWVKIGADPTLLAALAADAPAAGVE